MEQASDEVTKALERDGLFDMNVVLSRPFVAHEPVPPPPSPAELFAAPVSQLTPELQDKIIAALTDANQYVAYDRIWACHYDPLAGNVEVLGMAGDLKSEQKDGKKDLKPGHRLTLDSSASGWAVRHRKPRVDHDLASTQGRFLDHKYLFKDRLLSSLVVPFFVRGQVGGTITLASKEAGRYQQTDARTLEPIIVKIAEILQAPVAVPASQAQVAGQKARREKPPLRILLSPSSESRSGRPPSASSACSSRQKCGSPSPRSAPNWKKSRLKASSISTPRRASRTRCAI